MGIKWNDKVGGYDIKVYDRHPVTRMPKQIRRYRNDKRLPIKTMAEAKRIENLLKKQLWESFQEEVVPSYIDCCNKLYTSMRERGLAEKTVTNYEMCLSAHTYDRWKSKRIDEITTKDIRDQIIGMVDYSDAHKLNLLKFQRAVFRQAIEDGFLSRCPVPDMRISRKKMKIKKVLTEPEMEKLLNSAKEMECEWYEIWAAACYTGMRTGELYALPWDNVDLERRLISASTNLNSNKVQ
jgi:integrase